MKPSRGTIADWRAIQRPKDMTIRATDGECNYRRALMECISREASLEFIARHLYRVGSCGGDTKYTTPRLWYSAPFR